MNISPVDAKSSVFITNDSGKKQQITQTTSFYTTDSLVSVEAGSATGSLVGSFLDFSANTEFSYTNETSSTDSATKNEVIKFSK